MNHLPQADACKGQMMVVAVSAFHEQMKLACSYLQLDTKKELPMAVRTVMMKLMTVFQLIFFIFFLVV